MVTWDDYHRLRAALDRGEADTVLREIAAASADPGELRVRLAGLQAQAHLRLGRPSAAIGVLQRLVVSGEADYWTHHLLGQCYASLGESAEAAAHYRTAHALIGWRQSARNGYVFTHDYFSPNVPVWRDWFAEHITVTPIAALEIGSWQGGSATWLLDEVVGPRGGRLTCIDTFLGSSEHMELAAAGPGALEALFDANIARTGYAHRVRKLVGTSQAILPRLIGEEFDFIYIDGAHEAKFVIQDTVMSWALLRVGGCLLFDDATFTFPAAPEQDTHRAIDFFLSVFADDLTVIERGRQLLLRRTRP
jgi:predicted O-methyltransferase YrrM